MFAYCLNNPVNYCDVNGHWYLGVDAVVFSDIEDSYSKIDGIQFTLENEDDGSVSTVDTPAGSISNSYDALRRLSTGTLTASVMSQAIYKL